MDNSGDNRRIKTPKYAKGASEKRRWLNFFDILIIIVIVAGVLVAVFHNQIFNWATKGAEVREEEIQYVLEFRHVDAAFKKSLTAGDVVFLAGDSLSMGSIERVEFIEKSYEIGYDQEQGMAVKQSYPENTLVDITVVVNVKAKNTDHGYFVENLRLAIGASYQVKTAAFTGEAFLIGFVE